MPAEIPSLAKQSAGQHPLRRAVPLSIAGGLLLLLGLLLASPQLRTVLPLPPLPADGPAGGAPAPPVLFYESFDGQSLDPRKWQLTPGASVIPLQHGDLFFGGAAPASGWGERAIYSQEALPQRPGRTLATVARPSVGTVRGPLFTLSPQRRPEDPTGGAYGSGFDSLGGDAGNGGAGLRLAAVTPQGQVLYQPEVAQPIDYLLATTLKPGGSYHFVSGGAFGTFPTATLMWVNDAELDGDVYVGVDAKRTDASVSSLKVVDLPGAFTTPYGLARAMDGFDRPDSSNPGRTEVGALSWKESAGQVRLAAGALLREGPDEARATLDAGTADGIIEMHLRTPEAPFASPAVYFRYQDESNWWRVRCNTDRIEVQRLVAGQETIVYQTGALACQPNSQYHIVVRAHGANVNVWLNGRDITGAGGVFDDALGGATGVGLGFAATDASPMIDRLVVWPRMVTLPTAVGPAPTVPDADPQAVLLTDTFAETGQGAPAPRTGGRLQNHKPAVGGPWREYGGTWTVEGGRLVAPQGGTAVVFTRKPDAAAALTFDLPVPEDVGPGWSAGPVVRYAEGKGYIWARLFHKPGGSPLELWENDGGESRFLGASDVTARVARGGRHTIKLAAVGNRVAVYLDDALVLVRTTSVLEGNWAGILAADVPAGGFTFAGFQAMASKADTVPPPPVTELSGPSSTSDFPTLTWPPAVDDASGTRFYRVFRSTNPAELGRQINQDGATTEPAFTDTSLRSQGTYCYTVVAVDGAGNASLAGSARRCLTYQPGASPAGP